MYIFLVSFLDIQLYEILTTRFLVLNKSNGMVVDTEKISVAIFITQEWIRTIDFFVSQSWLHNPINQWKNETIKMGFLRGFNARINEVVQHYNYFFK